MMVWHVSGPKGLLKGTVTLDGSKSISNRVLLIRALCNRHFGIENLSSSKDTRLMQQLLATRSGVLDAGDAGTTFRFLTAYYATQPGTQVLTGSDRMKNRPIGSLVEALRQLGADIEYLEKEGFPPLKIKPPLQWGQKSEVTIEAGTSSQFISALLMIAPTLPNGLRLNMRDKVVSRPYIDMTLSIMAYFGVHTEEKKDSIYVPSQQTYHPLPFRVEADWSAASYFYALAAFSQRCELILEGLNKDSMQGDSVIATIMQSFGVESIFDQNSVVLSKISVKRQLLEQDFLNCPDLVQTLAIVCSGLGVTGLFSGLDTLHVKETDRIAALRQELAKVRVFFTQLPSRFSKRSEKIYYLLQGKTDFSNYPRFDSHNDHRMAMSLATWSMLHDVAIENPQVVEKSYPAFWENLERLGFRISELQN